jgi:cytochrome c biogenesis protein CcmG/thiol:disulfide interchange protein DsbE
MSASAPTVGSERSGEPDSGRRAKSSAVSWKVLLIGLLVCGPLVWILVRGLSTDPHRMDAPLVGKAAPPFSLARLSDGRQLSLADLRGQPLLLNFWSTWCIPCRTEHPVLVRGAQLYGDQVQFVGIVYQDRNEVVEQWLDRYGGRAYPTLIDAGGKTAIAYGVYGVPETYFVDRSGVIRDKHVGSLDDTALQYYLSRIVN